MHNWQFLLSIRFEQTKCIGLERVIRALFLSERKWNTENINLQGHCIGFQGFRGKNNKFSRFSRFSRSTGNPDRAPLEDCFWLWSEILGCAVKYNCKETRDIKLHLRSIILSKKEVNINLFCTLSSLLNQFVETVHIRSFSSPYLPAFGLNTERYGVSIRTQSECGKIWTRKTPNTNTFHAVNWVRPTRSKKFWIF